MFLATTKNASVIAKQPPRTPWQPPGHTIATIWGWAAVHLCFWEQIFLLHTEADKRTKRENKLCDSPSNARQQSERKQDRWKYKSKTQRDKREGGRLWMASVCSSRLLVSWERWMSHRRGRERDEWMDRWMEISALRFYSRVPKKRIYLSWSRWAN